MIPPVVALKGGVDAMRRTARVVLAAAAALVLCAGARAAVTLDAARVGAVDVAALAKFYESAFGLREVNRLQFRDTLEIMMNFGDSTDAAKANPNAQIVVMHRTSNALKDPVPHLIFNVSDMAATVAAIEAAGGKMAGKPRQFGNTGIVIGMAIDPAGNRMELIQQPKH